MKRTRRGKKTHSTEPGITVCSWKLCNKVRKLPVHKHKEIIEYLQGTLQKTVNSGLATGLVTKWIIKSIILSLML